MHTLSATTSVLTQSVAWALLSSLWQGLLIFGLLFVLLKALPDMNARIKYYASLSACMALFVWFAATCIVQYEKQKTVIVHFVATPVTSVTPSAGTDYIVEKISAPTATQPLPAQLMPKMEEYFPLLMMLYTIGLTFMLCRLLLNILQLGRLRKQGLTIPGDQWTDLLVRLQQQFGIARKVQLFLSERIDVPMMLGTLKPIILLPVATMNHLSCEQVEAILLHELAHIKRYDYLLNILQTIVETILFFNPFVWLVSAIVRREREHCCDDLVIAKSASPLPYARALAILESLHAENSLSLAVTGQKNYLLNRIKRIMEMKKSNVNYTQLAVIVVAIIVITASIGMVTFNSSYAQKPKKEKNTKDEISDSESQHSSTATDSIRTEINIVTNAGTRVTGYLFVYPHRTKKVTDQLTYHNDNGVRDWSEIKYLVDKAIRDEYKNIYDPHLIKEIVANVNIDMNRNRMIFGNKPADDNSGDVDTSAVVYQWYLHDDPDSLQVRIQTSDGSRIYLLLYGDPVASHKMIKEFSIQSSKNPTDWNDARNRVAAAIGSEYEKMHNPQPQARIQKEVNDYIDRQKKLTDLSLDSKRDKSGIPNFTQILNDSTGKQRVISVYTNSDKDDEEVRKDDRYQMSLDFEQMARDLKTMARDLTDAHIEMNSVAWDKIEETLEKNLAVLDKTFNDPKLKREVNIQLRKELDKSREAIEEAEDEIDRARNYHVKITAKADKTKGHNTQEEVEVEMHRRTEDVERLAKESRERREEARKLRNNAQSKREEDEEKDGETGKTANGTTVQTRNVDEMMQNMEEDGLIDRSKINHIQKKNDALYINDVRQPDAVFKKYSKYLRGRNINITLQTNDRW